MHISNVMSPEDSYSSDEAEVYVMKPISEKIGVVMNTL